jgi:FkbM family methyltransferase
LKIDVRKIKRFIKVALGKDFYIKPIGVYQKEKFGSENCGWEVVTEIIDSNSVIYSFGVGEDASFDTALIDKFNLFVHAFDPTPKSVEWVKSQKLPKNFIMHNYGIAGFDGNALFKPPDNPEHISHTILSRPSTESKAIILPVKRISSIMEELKHRHIDILKMDIEGAEYDVIDDIKRSNIRPTQILIEFHHRFPEVGVKKTKQAINTIFLMGYHLFSVSETGEELGFIKKYPRSYSYQVKQY